MRVMWICNIVLKDFSEEFGIKKSPVEGWMESLLYGIFPKVDIGLVFPIYDEWRMKNGVLNGFNYYTFHGKCDKELYDSHYVDEFINIFKIFKPDIIHIWGTEYNHSRYALEAAQKLGIDSRVVVRVQGVMAEYRKVMDKGIPSRYFDYKINEFTETINDNVNRFKCQEEHERFIISNAKHFFVRGDWDEFWVKAINPDANCVWVDNILRPVFYERSASWTLENCEKYTIFLAQAHYPIKGLHYMIRALSLLKNIYPNIKLLIAGYDVIHVNSSYAIYIKELISNYELDNNIVFLGPLSAEEMVSTFLTSHISVSPSTMENRANAICEAMMLGVPVVASYVGGNVGTIKHGEDGLCYPVDDIIALASCIDRVLKDERLSANLSKKSPIAALIRHDKERIVDIVFDTYSQIANTAICSH